MKKLGVSLVAVLVGLPMMARADISAIPLKGDPAGTVAANTNVATTSYVQGAYNDLAGHINTNVAAINTLNGDASTTGSVAKSISDALTTERSATQTLTNKTIDADDNTIDNLEVDNFKSGVVATTVRAAGENGADDNHLVTESAVRDAIDTATTGAVTLNGTQTLTNKTIDADDNTIDNLEVDNFKSGVVVDSTGGGIAAANSASDSKLVTEKAVASALADKADAATTLSGYGITDAYTKTEVDAHGFNVYGNWATPDTSTGSVTITSAGLTSNGNGGGNGGGE